MNGNELYKVLDKDPCPPMTSYELGERLKEIAALCIGLSIDLSNEIETRDNLIAENERLKRDLSFEIGRRSEKQNHRKVI